MRNPAGWSGSRANQGVILLGERGWSDPGRLCLPAGLRAREGREIKGREMGGRKNKRE